MAVFSASVPSQMWMFSGWHRRALFSTKSRTLAGSWTRSPLSTRRVWILRREGQPQGLSPRHLSLQEKKQRSNGPGVLVEDGQVKGTESWAAGDVLK